MLGLDVYENLHLKEIDVDKYAYDWSGIDRISKTDCEIIGRVKTSAKIHILSWSEQISSSPLHALLIAIL